jgi:phosphoenolpyruvate-protein phosphotransferase
MDVEPIDPPPADRDGERVLHGVAAAPGIAIGAAVFRHGFPRELVRREAVRSLPHAEHGRFRDALQKTRNDLLRLQAVAASELGEDEALIFGSHLMLLSDPMICERIERGIANGRSAAVATEDALDDVLRRLREVGGSFPEDRAEDIEDLRSRLLGHLLGETPAGTLQTQLVVSPNMAPSLVMEVKARGALGIASELGGTTSHGVLLARALAIPAVTGVIGILDQVAAGESLIIDGDGGCVVVRPSRATLDAYAERQRARERARTQFLAYRDRPPVTADGVRFALHANVALGVDLQVARENGAQGIGLYRTEFPFIVRDGVPTREEQVRIYEKAHQAFPAGPLWFRLLDLAGDKLVSANVSGIARGAFHGYRSIRVLFDYPHLLRDQVQALAIAAAPRPLWLLVPMVTSVEEIRQVKALVAIALAQHPPTAGLPAPRLGAMIEVPAAVEIVRELAREVDYFSIGTNDLIQYTLVIDRQDSRLSSPRHAFHPAILRMIRRVVQAAHAAGKQVGVCGEAASQREMAIALLALGVDVLSVTPPAIPELKQQLARLPLRPLLAGIDALLDCATAAELEGALRAYVGEHELPAIAERSIESKDRPSS